MPSLFGGVKLALSYALIGVIAGEFILSGSGLGYAISFAYQSFDNRAMYGLMLFVLLVAIAANACCTSGKARLARRRVRHERRRRQAPPPGQRAACAAWPAAAGAGCCCSGRRLAPGRGGVAITGPLETFAYARRARASRPVLGTGRGDAGRLRLAFALSASCGLLLGLLLGLRRFAGDVVEPVLAGFYTIPKVTLYPVVLLLFGLGMSAKVAFGVMHGLVPVTLFTIAAISTLPPVLPRTARALRLSPMQTMRWVLLPACLPQIVAGLRLGFSLSLLGVLIGEMFSSQRGLGFLLVNGLAQHNVALTTAVVLVIVVFAVGANAAMLRLSRVGAQATDRATSRAASQAASEAASQEASRAA